MKQQYRAPQLRLYGDLRDLTLGSSPGTTDKGMMGQTPKGLSSPDIYRQ